MRAVAVDLKHRHVGIVDAPDPMPTTPTQVVLRTLDVGVCGTDREIASFEYGQPPEGEQHLILGHEALAEVVSVGDEVGDLAPGDLVVPMVRRPCTVETCRPCRGGRSDYCSSGDYRERGIKELHGFLAERVVEERRWLHQLPTELRAVGVLVEPLTIAEKALAQVRTTQDRLPGASGETGWGQDRTAVVLGAGPVGLLGAMALIVEGFRTVVYSRSPKPNPKAAVAGAIGAEYISSKEVSVDELRDQLGPIEVIYEAAGVADVAFEVLHALGTNGVFVLTGVAPPGPPVPVDIAGLHRRMVLRNQVLLGTVNAGAVDFRSAIAHLGEFHRRWPGPLGDVISGRHPMDDYLGLVTGRAEGIKDVIAVGR